MTDRAPYARDLQAVKTAMRDAANDVSLGGSGKSGRARAIARCDAAVVKATTEAGSRIIAKAFERIRHECREFEFDRGAMADARNRAALNAAARGWSDYLNGRSAALDPDATRKARYEVRSDMRRAVLR